MSTDRSAPLLLRSEVVRRRHGDGVELFLPTTSTHVFLDDMGWVLLETLEHTPDRAAAIAAIVDEFDVDAATADADLETVVDRLDQAGFVGTEQHRTPATSPLDRARDRHLDVMERALVGMTDPLGPLPGSTIGWYTNDDPLARSRLMSMVGLARMRNVRVLAERALREAVPGDFMECGVWRGGCSIMMRAVLESFEDLDRCVWLADSFAGLPVPDLERFPVDEYWASAAGLLAASLADVREHFRRFDLLDDQVRFIQGWFSETLPTAPVEQLALLRLDGDLYESTMDALTNLYHRVAPGGFVIIDDFAIDTCRLAVEDFRAERGITAEIHRVDWTGVWWQVPARPADGPVAIARPRRGVEPLVRSRRGRQGRASPRITRVNDTGGIRSDDASVRTDETGRVADRMMFEHTARFERRWYTIADGVWCLVGNGLSNQSFVRGPEGLVAIDTGESIEEMNAALSELRRVTDEPVVAVLYTHFHYVGGTAAITAVEPVTEIHGHARIAENLTRSATEIAPTYGRGLVEQFGIQLPPESADGLVGVGLGRSYREPDHAPFTPGHVPATHVFDGPCTLHVAGLEVHVEPAPSDADDSVTYWFPSLGVAVHNLVWPTLFNVFAIRGETYRDPQVLLTGLDHLRSLGAEHLVATHGPPMTGAGDIARRVTAYRDSIQFLWDQTVRWTNRGASGAELAHRIRLPEAFGDDWITQQHYGLVEHHVRQIRSGLFGFFDGDPINLLPLDRSEHADRTVAAMGGPDAVRAACRSALQPSTDGSDGDLRWAVHLAALAADRSDADDSDRESLASALRTVARRVTAANIRNWCLTRARQLDGSLDMSRHNSHGFGRRQVEAWSLDRAVSVLRVLVDPDLLDGVDVHVAVECGQERSGLHVRNHVACPTDGVGATSVVRCERAVWNSLLTASTTLDEAVTAGTIDLDPAARRALSGLDHPAFR